VLTALRVVVAITAVITAISPLRQWAGDRVGTIIPGGAFFIFLLIYILYRPLRALAMSTPGLITAVVLGTASASFSIWQQGMNGARSVAFAIGMSVAVITARAILGASSRSFDARAIDASDLEPGMVLADKTLGLMAVDKRWQEAFEPHLPALQGVKLYKELIDNVQEWHRHNVPDEPIWIRAPLPFAPAFVIGVALTIWLGRIPLLH
jgi:hypothetical protein